LAVLQQAVLLTVIENGLLVKKKYFQKTLEKFSLEALLGGRIFLTGNVRVNGP